MLSTRRGLRANTLIYVAMDGAAFMNMRWLVYLASWARKKPGFIVPYQRQSGGKKLLITRKRSLRPPSRCLRLLPKVRFDFQFIHALDEAAQVVTENLAKCLIYLSRSCFTSK